PAIGRIERARRDRIIDAGMHVVPPKKFGAGELRIVLPKFLPDFPALDQMIGLFPKLNFLQFPTIPAIADDAMLERQSAGQIWGLGRASDCRECRNDFGAGARLKERFDARRMRADERLGETDDVDDGGALQSKV